MVVVVVCVWGEGGRYSSTVHLTKKVSVSRAIPRRIGFMNVDNSHAAHQLALDTRRCAERNQVTAARNHRRRAIGAIHRHVRAI